MTGALSMALLEMAARINDKRHKKSSGTAKKALALRKKFQRLILEDAKAFRRIQKAAGRGRASAMQSALKSGVRPLLGMAELSHQGWLLIKNERARTSKWLLSDVMEAFLLLDVVYGSALLTASVNQKSIKDRAFNRAVDKKMKKWEVHREKW